MTPTTPLSSLTSSPDISEDELADNKEDDQDDDASSYGNYSGYPAPHPKFITTAPSVVCIIKTYNPYEDPCFDPSKLCTHTIKCLNMIPFVEGKFDGQGWYVGSNE